jgi:tetratricopeptide (TPR) repeat protein
VLRAMQRLTVRATAPERVRAWQFEADVSESPERRADLFLKIGRTLLRHTNEHEKALTYLFWVLDQQPENLTALRLIEGVCRARGSYKPLAEILARELPLFDRPEERFPLARELGVLHETQEGDPDRAIARFEQALADQPGDAATARDLMRLYAATERMHDLRALLGDRLRLKLPPGERTEILLRLGELAEQHFRDAPTARQHYDQAMTTARLPGVPPATRRAVEAALTRVHAAGAPPPEPVPVPAATPPRRSTLEALDARELFDDLDALESVSSAALEAQDLLDDPDSATSGGEPEQAPEPDSPADADAPEAERARQQRRRAGGIHRHPRVDCMSQLGYGGDVADFPERIGRRLQPDELRAARLQGGGDRSCVGGVHKAHLEPAPDALRGEPVAQGPIHDLLRDDMIARRHGRDAAPHFAHDPCALMAEDGGKEAFGVKTIERVGVGVADAGGLDLDQHLAGARALQVDGFDGQRGAGLPGHGCAGLHGGAPGVRASG